MKILVGEFITESNANIPQKCEISNYKMLFGDDCIQALHVADVFEQAGFELIPSVVADAGAAGVIKKDTFDYIESCFVRTVKEHIHEIDGMFLMLHGASEVEGIGSGDHHILAEIRKVVGPYLPIFVVCDPHGNLCKEYAEATTLIRSYRESPHTDSIATMRKVAAMLCDFMKDRQNIHSVYRKLPLILGGEQSVSGDEPVRSINEYMDKLEQDPHIRSVSWHVGYIRHDTPVAGCGIVVVPQTEADLPYAEEAADWLAVYVWNKRREFHSTGLTAAPDKALRMALEFEGKPAFITDSGDNVTSGAQGASTFILRQVLAVPDLHKKVLFAAIHDAKLCHALLSLPIDTVTNASVGIGFDSLSAPVPLTLRVLYKGIQEGTHMYGEDGSYGPLVTVAVEGTPLVLTITDNNHSFVEEHQLDACGVDWKNFDIIVVKQGYIHPELKAAGALCVMSLTDGATPQDTRLIPFKRIMRPMFPIDNI